MERHPAGETCNNNTANKTQTTTTSTTTTTRRLTRVERARLEALQSFGCADFGSVLQTAKKVSLKSKLNDSKEKSEQQNEKKRCEKQTRRSGERSSGLAGQIQKRSQTRHRPTKTELAVVESLKGFDNNSLADITNSSKRIVSKFLNKPKISQATQNKNLLTDGSIISTGGENNSPTPLRNAKSAPSRHLKYLLEVNRQVLDTARELDQ